MAEAELQLDRIAVLPASVADGIAAGEVIDRPAAVVKELVENAIDAGARHIDVRVREAGQSLIEVVDDGRGMRPAELPVAFRRHATSKIRSLEDMRTVRTLGFRGEALASIAAVSRVEAVSRTRDGGGEGRRLVVEAGEVLESGVQGSPSGSRVSVSRLFFNTPARLKFLKQPATENAVIVRLLTELALAHPAIAMRLELDGRRVLETHGEGDLRAAFATIHGASTASAMLPVEEDPVHGLISPPAMHRPTRDHAIILVNGRRIHHRNLAFALEQAYRGLREPDRFPLAVLDLRVDPAEVDVNVHPTKREVRFKQRGGDLRRHRTRLLPRPPKQPDLRATAGRSRPRPAAPRLGHRHFYHAELGPRPARFGAGRLRAAARAHTAARSAYVGQLLNGYLVAEAPGAAVLIDQHAAHERVLFDRIMQRLEEKRPSSQMFLIPHVVEMTAAQAAAFEQHEAWLSSLGFEGAGLRSRAYPAHSGAGGASREPDQHGSDPRSR